MKDRAIRRLVGGLFLVASMALAGCGTVADSNPGDPGGARVTKDHGVYTTLAMRGQNLDLPTSGYVSYQTFAPGQTPVAVILGTPAVRSEVAYAQPYELQLEELATGRVLQTQHGEVTPGYANIVNLPIRKSGQYRLKLVINKTVNDTWDFSVKRNGAGDEEAPSVPPAAYAHGIFSVSVEAWPNTDALSAYDDGLIQSLNNAVQREYEQANQDDFAQRPAGHVAIQFALDAAGRVTGPVVGENTLSPEIAQFFVQALQQGAPYRTWPAEVRTVIGADTRTVKAIFYFE